MPSREDPRAPGDAESTTADDGDLVIEAPPRLTDELRTKIEELIDHAELVDIRPSEIKAALREDVNPRARVDSVNVEMAIAFATSPGNYANKFQYRFELVGETSLEPLGSIEFTLIVDYRVDDRDYVPDQDAATYFASTTGYFAAYPYARELFESMAGRLRFDPIVLGMIRRNSLKPGSVNVLRREPEVDLEREGDNDESGDHGQRESV